MKVTILVKEDDAVSPVIGVILMVAITVILAAVIGTFVLGLGSNDSTTPQTRFDYTFDVVKVELEVDIVGGTTIDSKNSGVLEGCSTWSVKITGLNATDPSPPTSLTGGSGPSGGYYCWNDSDGLASSDRVVLPVTPGSKVELLWKSPNGDKSIILDTFEVPT